MSDSPPQTHSLTRRSDGRRLNVRTWSLGQLSPMFLIHGFGDAGYVWNRFVRSLGPGANAAAIDLRGHGDSDWDAEGKYVAEQHAEDVADALYQMDLRRVVLVGHSLGAQVALMAAAAAPECAAALVLVDGGPDVSIDVAWRILRAFRAQSWWYSSVTDYVRILRARYPLVPDDALHEIAREALRPADQGLSLKCDPALSRQSWAISNPLLWTALHSVQHPILLVRGAMSAMLSRVTAQTIARTVRNVTTVTVPAAGHGVMLDNPAGFCNTVRPFLESIRAHAG